MKRLCAAVLAASMVLTRGASAQQSKQSAAAADSLFEEAKRLKAAGNFAEACPKFAASQRIDPALGTLMNLADCYEQLGQTASAWTAFREAAALSRQANDRERERVARDRAAALEPALSRLTIALAPGVDRNGLEVRLDGNVLDSALIDAAQPVDPGKHKVEAAAPGKVRWTGEVEVASKGAVASIQVPPLANATSGAAPGGDGPAGSGAGAAPDASSSDGSAGDADGATTTSGSGRRTMGIVAVGAGVVGVGIGGFFGLRASSLWSDADPHCNPTTDGNACDPEGVTLGKDAQSAGNISTIATVAGVALIGVGVVLWATAPPSSAPKAAAAHHRLRLDARVASQSALFALTGSL